MPNLGIYWLDLALTAACLLAEHENRNDLDLCYHSAYHLKEEDMNRRLSSILLQYAQIVSVAPVERQTLSGQYSWADPDLLVECCSRLYDTPPLGKAYDYPQENIYTSSTTTSSLICPMWYVGCRAELCHLTCWYLAWYYKIQWLHGHNVRLHYFC